MSHQVTHPTHPTQAESLWRELCETRQRCNRLEVEKLKLEGLLRKCNQHFQGLEDFHEILETERELHDEIRQALGEDGK